MADQGATLARFLVALTDRLDALSAEQLRAVLLAHATTLPPSERSEFLDVFAKPASGSTQADVAEPVLLADIGGFVSEVASGAYFQGYGWDDQVQAGRPENVYTWHP